MLAVSPLRELKKNERESFEMENGFSMEDDVDFPEFGDGNLLDSIYFDDLFVGIGDEEVLPDLDMDPEILAEFTISSDSEMDMNIQVDVEHHHSSTSCNKEEEAEVGAASVSASDLGSASSLIQGEEIVSKRHTKETCKSKKASSAQSKNPPGKRKAKVDWTPELHRRFVQAVEQLGVDKAVPSRILELMGIHCLTRHNIASHLQKYRSHRKHLLAREVEAANWSQRRQIYGGPVAGGGAGKRETNSWIAPPPPTMGFPPVSPMPHFRPLHVWGHPSVDQSLMHMWPEHVAPSPPPPPPHSWHPAQPHHLPLPPQDPSFWHLHHQHVPTPGTPCFPPHLPSTRFSIPPVPGIPPPTMYKADPGFQAVPSGQAVPQPPSDFHPSKESVDAAIGDVLSKPWLPLPLGLKPPSTDSVIVELQRQGISKIPPSCA